MQPPSPEGSPPNSPTHDLANSQDSNETSNPPLNHTTSQSDSISFPRFPDLPAELRVTIWHMALSLDPGTIQHLSLVQDSSSSSSSSSTLSSPTPPQALVILTRQDPSTTSTTTTSTFDALWRTCHESHYEARRIGLAVPARLVTDVGASVTNINLGTREEPMVWTEAGGGARGFRSDTHFFMDQGTAMRVLHDRRHGRGGGGGGGLNLEPMSMPTWLSGLRNLVLDYETFRHVLVVVGIHSVSTSSASSSFPGFLDDDDDSPFFAGLPALERIVVGFLHRWRDVAVFEGAYGACVAEVRVRLRRYEPPPPPAHGASPWHVQVQVPPGVRCRPLCQRVIRNVVRDTEAGVARLRRAGVEVVWGLVREGFTRRPDRYEWPFDP
ncbi:hypothetical protein F4778DRAFT_790860 [Xylariomycetidae sp. FL2044]|nr:hypothetical protein F4778DRAFT_790860 [Xylariomycetidae sp. FL2044]